ncbi:hypothetical protein ABPG75_006775 [Micractinium tetrahymenae]
MPVPWEQLASGLADLLPRFTSLPATAEDGEQLLQAAHSWLEQVRDQVEQPPGNEVPPELFGLLRQLGPALAALDSPLRALLR